MPSIAITRPYEAVYIVDPDLGEEQISAITGRYKQIVETNGGTVEKIDVWERRKLAYEVKGRTEGIYVIMLFSGTATVEAELRRIFQISEDQIRSLIVKQDEASSALPTGEPEREDSSPAAPVTEPVSAPVAVAAEAAPETESAAEEPVPATESVPAEGVAAD